MPLNSKGKKIQKKMKSTYGPGKGERVFHASKNKGTIKGVERNSGNRTSGGRSTSNKRRKRY